MILFLWIWPLISADVLLLSQVVFRHGARAPRGDLSSDEAKKHFFRGSGQLTNEGFTQAHELGKALSERLITNGFLDRRFLPNENSFRSSDSPRCISTTSAVGGALFDVISPGIPAFVDVHSVPNKEDFICAIQNTNKMTKLMFKSVGFEQKNNKTLDNFIGFYMKQLAKETHFFNEDSHLKLWEALIHEKPQDLPVPKWFTAEAEKEAHDLRFKVFSAVAGARSNSKQISKCRSGGMLQSIFDNIQNKVAEKKDIKKFYTFGTHDFIVMSLLWSLGVMDEALNGRCPQFTATVLFELWKPDNGGDPYVQLLMRDPKGPFRDLTQFVANCKGKEKCPVEDFLSCCTDFITKSPEKECL